MGYKTFFILLVSLLIGLALGVFQNALAFSTAEPTIAVMGKETIGNKPMNAANFKDWPNIMPVINNDSRVYHSWVNGDERFYFNSEPAKLNQLLIDFAKLKGKLEVIIAPQAEDVKTFDQKQSFAFNCQLHVVGGIAKHIAGKPKGNIYWPIVPQLKIHVAPKTDLAKLKIPKTVSIVSLEEIKARYKSGFDSTDKNVRGWGIGFLVRADPYDGQSLKTVSDLAVDADDWVALNALSNLKLFGPKVKDILPRLKEIEKSGVKQNAKRAKQLIEATEATCKPEAVLEFEKKEKVFRAQADQAKSFVDRVRGI